MLKWFITVFVVLLFQNSVISKDDNTTHNEIDSIFNTCCYYIEDNEISLALSCLHRLYQAYNNELDSLTLNKIYLKQAEAYIIINEYQKALEILYHAIDHVNKHKKDLITAEMYNKMGWLNIELGQYTDAQNYFLIAQEIMPDSLRQSVKMASIYNNLGIVYHKQAFYQDALLYYKKALIIFHQVEDEHGLSIGEINIGIIHFKKGQLSEAQTAFERALKHANKSNKVSDKIIAYINLGKVENKKGHYPQAISYFEIALKESRKIENKRLERKSLSSLSISFDLQKKWEKSLEYFKLYSQINDSIFNQEMASRFAEMQTRYETHEKEQENENLRKEKAYQMEKIQIKNKLLYFSLLLIFSLGIFGIVFFIQKRKQFNANKELLKKNIEIVKSERILNQTKNKLEQKILSLENNLGNPSQKYESSSLSENKKEILFFQLLDLIENEKLFTDPNISTSIFATKLNTNKNYISQVINEFHKSNFNHFINEYRIKEARELLSNNNLNKYTIEAIGNMVGFKSKSSFYQAFKKFTGLTPSFYINNMKNI
jgi:tetratricopeptide (TPR) repeat protein